MTPSQILITLNFRFSIKMINVVSWRFSEGKQLKLDKSGVKRNHKGHRSYPHDYVIYLKQCSKKRHSKQYGQLLEDQNVSVAFLSGWETTQKQSNSKLNFVSKWSCLFWLLNWHRTVIVFIEISLVKFESKSVFLTKKWKR